MDAIEKAIRGALDKGDAQNASYRERVYKSAFSALERALGSRDTITDEMAERRRAGLRAKILEIESEFVPAAGEEAGSIRPSEPLPSPPRDMAADAPEVAVAGGYSDSSDTAVESEGYDYEDEPRRRRPWAMLFMSALVVAAAGTGVWWTIQSGILLPVEERDGSVPNPPPKLDDESFRPEKLPDGSGDSGKADIPRNWIAIYETADTTGVTVPEGAKAELVERDGENYLRIGSSSAAELLFDIGEGTLERIAGGKAIFSVSARAQEGKTTQISVACELGELGDCGRKRYEVGEALSEFLFEVELAATSPGSAGTIAISPDITGSGNLLDIKEIRVAITE